MLKRWDNLPESFKNDAVRKYYDSLKEKQFSLFFKRVFDIVLSALMPETIAQRFEEASKND